MSCELTRTNQINEICTDCGICSQECLLMTKINKQPRQIASSLIQDYKDQKELVYSCSMCGRCDEVCPLELKPRDMFLEGRRRLVDEGIAPLRSHIFYMSDKKWNVYTIYRETYGIDYSDLIKTRCETVFFPGCNLATFAPKLTGEIFRHIASSTSSTGLILECCHKPIYDLGLKSRFEEAVKGLERKLSELGAAKIVTACPMCYYTLKNRLGEREVLSVYDLLKDSDLVHIPGQRFTIHDSCPDRSSGAIGSKVRNVLRECEVVEMEHSKEKSICCGAGGLVASVDPLLAQSLVKRRLDEAEAVKADAVMVYCMTCLNMLRSQSSHITISHVLSALWGVDEDYSQIQSNLQKMFTGPKARENMLKLMNQT